MMKILLPAFLALLIVSCNSSTTTTEPAKEAEPAPAETIEYAYMPGNHLPDNWDRGDQKNVALVLKSLKAYENGNVDEAMANFGDSVELVSSTIANKFSRDSLTTLLKQFRASFTSYKVYMQDYESVISKDKKEEYVGLWYKEVWTDTKGKTDSVFHMDDLKIENGKIVLLDEKTRTFPVAAK